jgi:hypothetical protein
MPTPEQDSWLGKIGVKIGAASGAVGTPSSKLGTEAVAIGADRATYSQAAAAMSGETKEVAELGLPAPNTAEDEARKAHGFRRAIEADARERTPPAIRKVMEARNLKKYGDPLGPEFETLAKTKTPMKIIESAGKTNKVVNAMGKAAETGGAVLEVGGKVVAVAGAAAAGVQIGTGIQDVVDGKTATGATEIVSGATSLGLDVAATAAVQVGTAGAMTAGSVAAAAGGSVLLATETVHAAIEGEETPLEVADKFYGTHFSDIAGWVKGDYRKP